MIDARVPVRRISSAFTSSCYVPLIKCSNDWYATDGHAVRVGLVDTDFEVRHPDVVGADIVRKTFAEEHFEPELNKHGTHSVTTIVGQGNREIRGIAPQVQLFVASVVSPSGIADPQAVSDGIAWLIEQEVQLIAMPLGGSSQSAAIEDQIRRGTETGTIFFAARGTCWSDKAVYPAMNPRTISVGPSDDAGNLWFEASRIPRLDLIAPGWNVAAPVTRTTVAERSGSSVACVISVAVAALFLSYAGAFRPCSKTTLLRSIRASKGRPQERACRL